LGDEKSATGIDQQEPGNPGTVDFRVDQGLLTCPEDDLGWVVKSEITHGSLLAAVGPVFCDGFEERE
jgi:hypothetical protein